MRLQYLNMHCASTQIRRPSLVWAGFLDGIYIELGKVENISNFTIQVNNFWPQFSGSSLNNNNDVGIFHELCCYTVPFHVTHICSTMQYVHTSYIMYCVIQIEMQFFFGRKKNHHHICPLCSSVPIMCAAILLQHPTE